MKVKALPQEELDDLVDKSADAIKEIVRRYGEQGCSIKICPKCGLMASFTEGGLTVSGPQLTMDMYCNCREGGG